VSVLALFVAAAVPSAAPTWPTIDRIEHRITLPRGAKPLVAYARHYATSAPDTVTGVYIVPEPVHVVRPDECEEMTADLGSRPCDPADVARSNREAVQAAARAAKPGERRRYRRVDDMPYVSDGGCTQINVRYRPSTGAFLSVNCNGRG
jgi:hypothetical protein